MAIMFCLDLPTKPSLLLSFPSAYYEIGRNSRIYRFYFANSSQEAKAGKVDLTEEDPDIVALVVGYLYNMDYSDEDAVVAIEDGAQDWLRQTIMGSISTSPSEGNIAEIMANTYGTDEQKLERARAAKEANGTAVSSPLPLLFLFPMHSLARLLSSSNRDSIVHGPLSDRCEHCS